MTEVIPDKLDIRLGETVSQMVTRLVDKTGEVAPVIYEYCAGSGLETPQKDILAMCGAYIAAMGRHSTRHSKSPKTEWDKSLRANNFMIEIGNQLGEIDRVYPKRTGSIISHWREIKPGINQKLNELGILDLENESSRNSARREITLAEFKYLEGFALEIGSLLVDACNQYQIPVYFRKGLTEKILKNHYPNLPDYEENQIPLAYEVKALKEWERKSYGKS